MDTKLMKSSVYETKRTIGGDIWERYVTFVDQRTITTYVVRSHDSVHSCSKIFLADTGYTMYLTDMYATDFRTLDRRWVANVFIEYDKATGVACMPKDTGLLSKKFTFAEEKENENEPCCQSDH